MTIGDLEEICSRYKNKNTPVYINVLLCDNEISENNKTILSKAKETRFVISCIKKTRGPLYDGNTDILDPHHGCGVDIFIFQNESLRVH